MKHSRLWVLAAIIAFVIFTGFILSVPHTRDVSKPLPSSVAMDVPTVSLHDSFKKGVHTITGSLQAPNACAAVTAEATLEGAASTTGSILVALSLPRDSGVCLQVPTKINFTATINAPARLPITATVNGAAATTTIS